MIKIVVFSSKNYSSSSANGQCSCDPESSVKRLSRQKHVQVHVLENLGISSLMSPQTQGPTNNEIYWIQTAELLISSPHQKGLETIV
jgi:hypothetical protein